LFNTRYNTNVMRVEKLRHCDARDVVIRTTARSTVNGTTMRCIKCSVTNLITRCFPSERMSHIVKPSTTTSSESTPSSSPCTEPEKTALRPYGHDASSMALSSTWFSQIPIRFRTNCARNATLHSESQGKSLTPTVGLQRCEIDLSGPLFPSATSHTSLVGGTESDSGRRDVLGSTYSFFHGSTDHAVAFDDNILHKDHTDKLFPPVRSPQETPGVVFKKKSCLRDKHEYRDGCHRVVSGTHQTQFDMFPSVARWIQFQTHM
jgi:hypothetical protein